TPNTLSGTGKLPAYPLIGSNTGGVYNDGTTAVWTCGPDTNTPDGICTSDFTTSTKITPPVSGGYTFAGVGGLAGGVVLWGEFSPEDPNSHTVNENVHALQLSSSK